MSVVCSSSDRSACLLCYSITILPCDCTFISIILSLYNGSTYPIDFTCFP